MEKLLLQKHFYYWKRLRAISGAADIEKNDDDDIPVQNLSKYKKGDKLNAAKITVLQGFTKPPARYTEGTLLAAMESRVSS